VELLTLTHSESIADIQLIQGVGGGDGQLLRVFWLGGQVNAVLVKLINTPQPKGWNTNLSHQRKLFSYQIESYWYEQYAHLHQ
jgi:hypothetical protein